jgi:hypothetical protein
MFTMRPGALLLHVHRGSARELERTAHVGRVHAVPDVEGELVELREGDADVPRRIVDEHVEAPERVRRGGDGGFDRRGVGLVELHGHGAAPEPLDGLDGPSGAVEVAHVPDCDVRARPSEREGDGRPEVARSARYQRPAPAKVHADPFPPGPRVSTRRVWSSSVAGSRFSCQPLARGIPLVAPLDGSAVGG